MKYDIFVITCLILLLGVSACCDHDPICACADYEDCVEGECELKDNHFLLNGSVISGSDLYYGVVDNHSCLDSLVFDIEPDDRFFLAIRNPGGSGVQNVGLSINWQYSETEYVFGTGAPFCYQNGRGWYADIPTTLYLPDSVRMNFYFWTIDAPGEYVDSIGVTFIK